MGSIRDKIKSGSDAVHQLATETLKETYTRYAGVTTAPGGQDISSTLDSHMEFIASSLADLPGGLDVLYKIARERYPQETLPYKEYFLKADPAQLGPELKKALLPIITEELIPEYIGRNRAKLQELAAAEIQSGYPGGSRDAIDGLAALYDRAGQDEFSWHMFMDLRNAKWTYYSFDPIPSEQVPFDQLITRYRKVTMPKDMDAWFETGFEANDANNWGAFKWGKSPFGHYMGKLPARPIHKCNPGCIGPGCYGATKANTFWEKEVLLLRQHFTVPPIKPGHRYRLRVNDGNHVGSGGGHIIYINGKPLIETKTCNGRGAGGLPKGAYITKEFLDSIKSGSACIAVMTFLRFNDKYKVKPTTRVPQGKFSLHLEEQKLPRMDDELLQKSATVVSMLSSEWQAAQDPADRERQTSAVKFLYDGKFSANPSILGHWKTIGSVNTIDDFTPDKRLNPRSAKFATIQFENDGKTDNATRLWSGNTLMDLTRYEALQMKTKTIDNEDYLFIEAGGFSTRNPVGWQSKWYVMKR